MSIRRHFPSIFNARYPATIVLLMLAWPHSAPGWPSRWQHAEVPLPLDWHYHPGDVQGASADDCFDAHWPSVMVPNTLQPALLPNNAEVAWYRLRLPIGGRYARKRLILELGRVTGTARVFVNGRELEVVANTTPAAFYIEHMQMGEKYGLSRKDDVPLRAFLPTAALRFGALNTFAVRVQAGDERGPNIIGPLQVRCQGIEDLLEFRQFTALDTDPQTQMGGISLFFRRPYWISDAAAIERDWPLQVTVTDYFGVPVAAKDIVVPMSRVREWRDTIPFKVECDQMYRLTFRHADTDSQLRYRVWCSKLDGERQRLGLNGIWNMHLLAERPGPLPDADATWTEIGVPMPWHWAAEPYGQQTDLKHGAWMRRSFTVPASMHGKRLELSFANIKAAGRVYLNGHLLAEQHDAWVPLRIDVTDTVLLDKPNELLVALADQSALLAPGVPLPPRTLSDTRQESYSGVVQHALRYTEMGLPGPVDLHAHPYVFVRNVFVRSHVADNTLEVTVLVRNDSPTAATVNADFRILRNGTQVDTLEPGRLNLEPGTESRIVTRGKVNLERWSVKNPVLHQLRLRLTADSEVLDVLDTRFGYREITVDKDRFLLNGETYNLRRTSFGGAFEMSPNAVDRVFARHLDSGINLLRTHNVGYRNWWFDIADELGLPIQLEGAWFGYKQAVTDPGFWKNIRFHTAGLAANYRNHPSLTLCTLGNEVQHNKIKSEDRAGLIALWKQYAPHVPVGFDDDYGYDDGKDFICIHYPYPVFMHLLWPDSAYWLQTPAPLKIDRAPGVMQWRREQPLIIGELFGPPYANVPDGVSVLGGDEVYSTRDSAWPWWVKGQKMLVDGCRLSGGAGSDPWHFQQTDSWMNASLRPPVAAIMREWDQRFYGGGTGQRTPRALNLSWAPAEWQGDSPWMRMFRNARVWCG